MSNYMLKPKKNQYHLKHKYGISPAFNSHQETNPWYSMGQGSGDGCNWWVIRTDSMTDAYNKEAQHNRRTISLPSPASHTPMAWNITNHWRQA